jgi:alcohol dehydrogenase class IV
MVGMEQFHSPTKMFFGFDVSRRLGEMHLDWGRRRVLLISGRSAADHGYLDRIEGQLEELAVEGVYRYCGVTSDPTTDQVDEIVALSNKHDVHCMVAIGGGSALDAAKAASVIALEGGAATTYYGRDATALPSLPLVAIPTTAGTGAEASQGAILTDPIRKKKFGLRGSGVAPNVAIVDPLLTLSVPRRQVALTGFDILTHAVETFVSRRMSRFSAEYSRQAVRLVVRSLPVALRTPDDFEARADLSFAALLMGINLANASTCLPHRLQYPLGVMTGTAHAEGLLALYLGWIEVTKSRSAAEFSSICQWFREADNETFRDVEDLGEAIGIFKRSIGLEISLGDLGVSLEDTEQLVAGVEGNLTNDPWWQEGCDIGDIYRAAF